jgi:two-component system sensor histidine kinase/response regulator
MPGAPDHARPASLQCSGKAVVLRPSVLRCSTGTERCDESIRRWRQTGKSRCRVHRPHPECGTRGTIEPNMSNYVPEKEQVGARFGTRVLLAEDNIVTQQVTLAMLERLGCQVAIAGNGREALDALSCATYDLVLMDCHMPELDGLAATQELRRREHRDGYRVPVIAITASDLEGDREECLVAGMDDYIVKPVTLDKLRDVLGRWQPADATPPGREAHTYGSANAPAGSARPAVRDPIDRRALANIRQLRAPGRQNLLGRVVAIYLKDATALVAALREATSLGDTDSLHKDAHRLKSSSANLGALTLAGLCKKLEEMGRCGVMAGALTVVAEIEQEFQAVSRALARECEGGES